MGRSLSAGRFFGEEVCWFAWRWSGWGWNVRTRSLVLGVVRDVERLRVRLLRVRDIAHGLWSWVTWYQLGELGEKRSIA